MHKFFRCAARPSVVGRSIKVALVITPILTVFNHLAEILALELGMKFWLQVALTFTVPYCVSTYSSAMAVLHEEEKRAEARPSAA